MSLLPLKKGKEEGHACSIFDLSTPANHHARLAQSGLALINDRLMSRQWQAPPDLTSITFTTWQTEVVPTCSSLSSSWTGEKTADSCQKLIGHGRVGAVTLESRSRYGAAGTLLFLTRTATASCSARAPAQPGCASCGQVGRPPVHSRLPVAESEDCASAGACSRASTAAGAAAAAAGMGTAPPGRYTYTTVPVHRARI